MEIHQHTHTPRKKWTHYFFEFFMLFLAVFLGYVAEWRLEHNIESGREKSAMRSLLVELQEDIRQIDSLKARRLERNRDCDLLINLLTRSETINDSTAAIYFYGRQASRRMHFRSQNSVLEQFRQSGGFRIHHQEVKKLLGEYDLLLQSNLENIEVEEKELSEYTGIAARVFDARVFQEITATSPFIKPAGQPLLLAADRGTLNELAIKLHYWKRTSLTTLEGLDDLKNKALQLISTVKDHYNFK